MNFKLWSSAVLLVASFGLIACDESNPSSSSNATQNNGSTGNQGTSTGDNQGTNQGTNQGVNPSSGTASCNVSTTSNSVTIEQIIPGTGSYTSTVTDNGTRYRTIKSVYTYSDAQALSEECEREKKQASSWNDGSVQVTCSGDKIYVDEVDEGSLQEHEADFREVCEDFLVWANGSTSNNTSNTGNSAFKCEVTRSDNAITINQVFMGEAFEETTTWAPDGSYAIGVREITYTDAEEAAEECSDEKSEARYSDDASYTVECTTHSVKVTKKVKNYDIDSYEAYYKAWCEDQNNRFQSGDMSRYI